MSLRDRVARLERRHADNPQKVVIFINGGFCEPRADKALFADGRYHQREPGESEDFFHQRVIAAAKSNVVIGGLPAPRLRDHNWDGMEP
jgi:hypothetical protein